MTSSDDPGALRAEIAALEQQLADLKTELAEVRQSEARLQVILSSTTDWAWEVNDQLQYTYISPNIITILGYIAVQQAALRELSTPLIPITDNTMVMPLIGTIDSARAQQVLETMLEGVAQHQANLVILDITGVQTVDTQVANALIRAAQAVKLLGAQVVLTGIRPDVAQTLVHLGTDLAGLITHSTLQAGIAYALQRRSSHSA